MCGSQDILALRDPEEAGSLIAPLLRHVLIRRSITVSKACGRLKTKLMLRSGKKNKSKLESVCTYGCVHESSVTEMVLQHTVLYAWALIYAIRFWVSVAHVLP